MGAFGDWATKFSFPDWKSEEKLLKVLKLKEIALLSELFKEGKDLRILLSPNITKELKNFTTSKIKHHFKLSNQQKPIKTKKSKNLKMKMKI